MNSIPLEGYECYGKTPIPEPISSNPAMPPELREVLAPPKTRELWLYCVSILTALQATISIVTYQSFERIVLHYSKTGEVMPGWIVVLALFVAFAGELLIFGVSGQMFEIHVRKLLFYKSLQFGVLIDYKNISDKKKYFNLGGFCGVFAFIASFVLMWVGYSNSKNKNWYEFLSVVSAFPPIALTLHKVIKPYLDCAALEDSLISLPKFLERNPSDIKNFLLTCQVLPEQAVYARLCDLTNIQRDAALRAKFAFARSVGVGCSDPALIGREIARLSDKSHVKKCRELVREAARSVPLSLSQLHDCGEEGKEVRGAIQGKRIRKAPIHVIFARMFKAIDDEALYEGEKYAYIVKNSSKDIDAILMGRYTSLMVGTYWVDDEITKFVHGNGSLLSPDLNTQFLGMVIVLVVVATYNFMLSAAKLAELGQSGSA